MPSCACLLLRVEHLVDRQVKELRDPEGQRQRRKVAAALDGDHRLAGDAQRRRALRLGQPPLCPLLPDPVSHDVKVALLRERCQASFTRLPERSLDWHPATVRWTRERPVPPVGGLPGGRGSSRGSGSAGAGYGTDHCWLLPPLQVHRSSWVPCVVVNPGSSRHLPETGFTSSPFTASHCWLPPPLQVHSSMRAPFAVLAPVTSRHFPLIPTVPLDAIVQVCAAALLSQLHICTFVPSAAEPPLTSAHSAVSSPAMICPLGVAEPARVTDKLSNWSV